jgi:phosphate starvation-inducible PhoH-like protein
LREARELLSTVEGIAFCEFTDADVVRHPLVQKIVVAYEALDQRRARQKAEGGRPPRDRNSDEGGTPESA